MAELPEIEPTSNQKSAPDHTSDATISRRQFIQGVMVASAAGIAGLPVTASGEGPGTATPGLAPEHGRVLAAVLNRIIPADGVMPAAGDLGVAGFMDQALGAAPHLRSHITGLLAALPDEDTFNQLPDAEADALLRRLEADQRDSFDILLQATYTGYYSHARIQEILGWVDPVDLGYRVEPFDAASLDGARERGLKLTSAMIARSGSGGS